jgi:uncharacterized protein
MAKSILAFLMSHVKITRMIKRRLLPALEKALSQKPAVVLLGPRQVGKTTLALALAQSRPSIYLDLERPSDQKKLADAELFLSTQQDKLVILDEIQRQPELFPLLRSLIDQGRLQGQRSGRFLLLGSASMALLRQSSESLAGRIAHLELTPIDILEIENEKASMEQLWLRGGFPDSFLESTDADSLTWRQDFILTYLERDIPMFAPKLPSEMLRRFWTMLAHSQGSLLNASQLAAGLAVSSPTVSRYTDLMVDLLLVRRLQPFYTNIGKRLVKSPKVYVRDSGILHALLGIVDLNSLLGHPVVGMSWEGFVIETLINVSPPNVRPGFYRTAAGAEIDLILEFPDGRLWAIEIKLGLSPKVNKGFHLACQDLSPEKCFVVYSGKDRYPLSTGIEAISLQQLSEILSLTLRQKT